MSIDSKNWLVKIYKVKIVENGHQAVWYRKKVDQIFYAYLSTAYLFSGIHSRPCFRVCEYNEETNEVTIPVTVLTIRPEGCKILDEIIVLCTSDLSRTEIDIDSKNTKNAKNYY